MTSADDSPLADFAGMGRLDGRGLLVVGAGQGIGRQTATALTQAGAQVLCCDIRAQTIVVDGGITNTFPYPMAALAELAGIAGGAS